MSAPRGIPPRRERPGPYVPRTPRVERLWRRDDGTASGWRPDPKRVLVIDPESGEVVNAKGGK